MLMVMPPFPGPVRTSPTGHNAYVFTSKQVAWIRKAYVDAHYSWEKLTEAVGVGKTSLVTLRQKHGWTRPTKREQEHLNSIARKREKQRLSDEAREARRRNMEKAREKKRLDYEKAQLAAIAEKNKRTEMLAIQGDKVQMLLHSDISNPDASLIQAKEDGRTNHSHDGSRNENPIIGKCIGERCFLYGSWSCLINNTQGHHRKDCNALF